jgi:hypothetical protein
MSFSKGRREVSCYSIIGFPKLGLQDAVTAKAVQLLSLKKYLASRTPLPSQIIRALIMALYAAVSAFTLASQVSWRACGGLL